MKKPRTPKYSPEIRERAVRLVQEHRDEYPSLWAAIESLAPKIGCVPQTLHEWVRRHEVDTGLRDGVSGICQRSCTPNQDLTVSSARSGLRWTRDLCAQFRVAPLQRSGRSVRALS